MRYRDGSGTYHSNGTCGGGYGKRVLFLKCCFAGSLRDVRSVWKQGCCRLSFAVPGAGGSLGRLVLAFHSKTSAGETLAFGRESLMGH